MPFKSDQQRKYVFFLRNKYKNKQDTPEEHKWIWKKEWTENLSEDIVIPLNPGDIFAHGKFKNKKAIYASHYTNEKGDIIIITDTGKEISMAKIRLMTEEYESYFDNINLYESYFEEKCGVLEEELTISDLMKDQGISNLTKKFKKDRTGKVGSEANNATIVDFKANKKKGWIEFTFRTRATPYPEEKNHKYTMTDKPKSWRLKKNPARTYIMKIRILDFFKWIKTTPDNITNKDIEDVLEVANVMHHCSDTSYNYQGFAFNSGVFDASIYKQSIAPTDKKNSKGTVIGWKTRHDSGNPALLCKHLSGLYANIKFFIPQMRMIIKKELGLTKGK